ncbi:diiron oxygenase [Sphingomonas cavernae]|uniref:Ferritin-like domain-containing protein n=1 Tax=Sphingomonas cavernae TaxID=2320861 RepID=A0A418W7W7_9SPHN|nr:diiron oxygenase [Sphingomonas cavernae]RJF86095.1 hypothetical protein D3876_19940 [Sphingomonas cavernae]
MYQHFSYEAVLSASQRATWQIDDVIGPDAALDFSRPFMPQALARTAAMEGLSESEKLILNQIRGHEYLSIFGLVEEFILPFVLDHARPHLSGNDWRVRALLQFAGEEAKHIQLFKRFHEAFVRDFGTECAVIGPAEAVAAEVLRHDPLAVALVILQIEWMTQSHYVDSVRDDDALDPLFSSLLKHHWMEEAQHARLDTLMVKALAQGRDERGIAYAIDEYLEIGAYLDAGLKTQTRFNLDAFERASGRVLDPAGREAFLAHQHQAMRWTYLGSGMAHPRFRATLGTLSPEARARIEEIAPVFA